MKDITQMVIQIHVWISTILNLTLFIFNYYEKLYIILQNDYTIIYNVIPYRLFIHKQLQKSAAKRSRRAVCAMK